MSLRYRLSKDKFKDKKLPPKNPTNEDLIDPDQRGNISSDDPEFDAIHRFKEAMRKPIEETEFSRRGIFGSLNMLKEYAEKSEQLQEEHTVKIKKKRKKKKVKIARAFWPSFREAVFHRACHTSRSKRSPDN